MMNINGFPKIANIMDIAANRHDSRLATAVQYEEKNNARTKTIDGFSYLKLPRMDRQSMRPIVKTFTESYKALYMAAARTVRLDHLGCQLNGTKIDDYDNNRLKNRFARAMKNYDKVHSTFRIATDQILYTFDIGQQKENQFMINITQASVKYKYIRMSVFSGAFDDEFKIYPLIIGDVMLDVDSKIPKAELACFATNSVQYLQLLTYACELMVKSPAIQEEHYTYSQPQLDIMLELFQRTNENGKRADIVAYQSQNWVNPNHKDAIKELPTDNISGIIDDIFNGCESFNSVPLLDFSNRDFNWIYKYCKSHDYEISTGGKYINLASILKDQRYGLRFRVICDHDDIELFEAGIYIDYDEDSDNVRVTIINENHAEGFVTIVIANYPAASKFNVGEFSNISELHIVGVTLGAQLAANIQDVCRITPLSYIDLKGIIKIIINIVQVLIVIHDRPERNRMITEEHPRKAPNTSADCKGANNNAEYVIRRIIKSATAAKKYIAEKAENGDKNVRYTMEQWERRGHYRTYKDGRRVWIDETTCHRHKELSSGTEIHIKL